MDLSHDESDIEDVLAILQSRPGAYRPEWRPLPGATLFLARDEQGVAAFLLVRIDMDESMVIADQIESWWNAEQDRPTLRGFRAMSALNAFMEEKARQYGLKKIVSTVASSNLRHLRYLEERLGYRDELHILVKELT